MKLTKLKLNKYRIIRPGTEFSFGDGIHLLIGKNGTGKTTLLDLLAMIFGCSFTRIAHEEFSLEYQFRHLFGMIDVAVRNWMEPEREDGRNVADERIPPRRLASAERPSFRYELSIELRSALPDVIGFRLKATNASTVVEYDDGEEERWDIPVSPFPEGNFINYVFKRLRHPSLKLPKNRKQWRFPRGVARLDESTEWLRKVLVGGSISTIEYYDEHEHTFYYSAGSAEQCPAELATRLDERLSSSTERANGVVFSDRGLEFLRQTVQALGYREASVAFELKKANQLGTDDGVYSHFLLHYGNFRVFFVKRDGSRVPQEDLSFGEKRVLSFYYYLATYDHVLIADELANGMHHDMIDRCVEAIGDRQAFLSTQNPLLLDHLGFSSADEVRASFVLCRCVTEQNHELMVLRHMTIDEAQEFFADYCAGIQHVNEVLRMRGLW